MENNIQTETKALEKETFYIKQYDTLKGKKGYNQILSSLPRMIINGKLICSTCNLQKTIDNFYKNKNTYCGYHYMCISCKKEYLKQNKERDIKIHKQYYSNNKYKIFERKKLTKDRDLKNNRNYKQNNKIKNKKLSLNELCLATPDKICTLCNYNKSTKNFSRLSESADGFNYCCKSCYQEKRKMTL